MKRRSVHRLRVTMQELYEILDGQRSGDTAPDLLPPFSKIEFSWGETATVRGPMEANNADCYVELTWREGDDE